MRVGYPRALLYYYCFPFWKTFFESLGHEIVTSSPTNRVIMQEGVARTVGEACLPVKAFVGHVNELRHKVDVMFIPRVVSLERRTYICPKFMGLPSMVKATLTELPPVIEIDVNAYRGGNGDWGAARAVGDLFGYGWLRVVQAYERGRRTQKRFNELLLAGYDPSEAIERMSGRMGTHINEERAGESGQAGSVLLLGHPYTVHDGSFNLQLKERLRLQGYSVLTMESLKPETAQLEADQLPKNIFWSLGRRMVGTARHLLRHGRVQGVVHVAAFGCGPDSLIGEIVGREARTSQVPFLPLVFDEHTGEAGVQTRVEAFTDMLGRRRHG